MTQNKTDPATRIFPQDCIFQTILDFMLPFFLAGAGSDVDLARAAIFELLDAYNATTTQELDLAGRIIIFSTAAMDNLRLSMSDADMSDAKKLRYRSSAVALSRSAEHCRKVLDALQARPRTDAATATLTHTVMAQPSAAEPLASPPGQPVPLAPQPSQPETAMPQPKAEPARMTAQIAHPSAKSEQPAVRPAPRMAHAAQVVPPGTRLTPSSTRSAATDGPEAPSYDIERMKREASIMIQALHAEGVAVSAAAHPTVPDPKAAAHAALAAAGFTRA